ncbi:MAG: RluA family pseudouridine synthase [Bacillota bacterium]|nr:RluA family pseudouridine synthase [Bacillota bacterium]
MTETLEYIIEQYDLPCSVGGYLQRRGFSRGLLRSLRASGGVSVDGVFRRMIEPLDAGEHLRVAMPEAVTPLVAAPALDLEILYEDGQMVVINKPDDMLVHPAGRGFDDAVGNFYAARWPQLLFRPIGRLDRHTSGCCLIAKNRPAAALLSGHVDKLYFGVVEGRVELEQGVIDAPLLRVPGRQIKRVVGAGGKPSRTAYRVLRRYEGYSLLCLRLFSGRTHQIRAHLAHIGHPLCGDALYGGGLRLIARQALHCGQLSLRSPADGRRIIVNAPLPADMAALLTSASAQR